MEPDPRYVLPRRSLVGPTLGVVAALLGAALIVARQCAAQGERERSQRAADQLRRAADDLRTAQAPPTLPATEPDAAPVEFELVRGDARHELTAGVVELGDRVLVLRRTPTWVWTSPRLSLSHPSSVRAATTLDGVLLSSDEATAEIGLFAASGQAADALAALRAIYVSTGRVLDTRPATATILGRPITGERVITDGPTFEIYVAGAGGGRELRIILSTASGGSFTALRDALSTITVTPRPRVPEFEARLKGADGAVLGTASAQLDQPFTIGDEQLTIARRATIREQRRGVRFEHDPGLVVIDGGAAVPAFLLRQRDIAIQLMAPPFRMEPADLAAAGGMLTSTTPFTRRVGTTDYAGVRGSFAMGDLVAETQILAFDRGGRSFVVVIQSPATAAAAAAALADAVIASAR